MMNERLPRDYRVKKLILQFTLMLAYLQAFLVPKNHCTIAFFTATDLNVFISLVFSIVAPSEIRSLHADTQVQNLLVWLRKGRERYLKNLFCFKESGAIPSRIYSACWIFRCLRSLDQRIEWIMTSDIAVGRAVGEGFRHGNVYVSRWKRFGDEEEPKIMESDYKLWHGDPGRRRKKCGVRQRLAYKRGNVGLGEEG